MDTSRISFGEMVAAASGIALLMFMSAFKWFTVANDPTGLGDRNAWETFTLIDLVLFLVALAAVGLAVARAARVDLRGLPAPPGLLVAAGGALACALILLRLLVTPDLEIEYPGVTGSVEAVGGVVDRGIGIFLGLAAAAGIAFGGYTATKERASGKARRR
ncbi:MAG: hypothetical protein ACREX8_08935 [Gammaproteobacteria bacterium]